MTWRPYGSSRSRPGVPPSTARRSAIRDHTLQIFGREPVGVPVAAVAESVSQGTAVLPALALPPRKDRLQQIHVVELERVARLVLGNQQLVQLFAGPDPRRGDAAFGCDGLRKIHHTHAR